MSSNNFHYLRARIITEFHNVSMTEINVRIHITDSDVRSMSAFDVVQDYGKALEWRALIKEYVVENKVIRGESDLEYVESLIRVLKSRVKEIVG